MAETFQDLIARGLEPAEIARLVRTKQLTRIRRGIYIGETEISTPEQRHRELIEATVPVLAAGSVLSHVSAAVLHDLPVPISSLTRVHFTRPKASGRISRYAHRHGAALPDECTTSVDEFLVTGVERTVADLCRFVPYPDAVAVVDAALRNGVSPVALEEELASGHHRPNNDRFRRAIAFGDGRAESPGESHSRVLMAQLDLPTPTLQREFRNAEGEIDARTDFDWEEYGAVGEFDGKSKYGRLIKPGRTLEEVIRYEKRREELLRRHGRWVIRWTFDELADRDQFRRLVLQGLRRGLRAA